MANTLRLEVLETYLHRIWWSVVKPFSSSNNDTSVDLRHYQKGISPLHPPPFSRWGNGSREELTGSRLHELLVVQPENSALLPVHVPLKLHTSDLAQSTASDSRASISKEEPGQQTSMQPSSEGHCLSELQMSTLPHKLLLLLSLEPSSLLVCLLPSLLQPPSLHACTIWNHNSANDLCNFAHPLCHILPCGPTPTQIYQVQSVFLLFISDCLGRKMLLLRL